MHRLLPPLAVLILSLARLDTPDAWADEKKPVNLLRLPSAKLERSTAPAGDQEVWKKLTDGDPATIAKVKAPGGIVDFVYGFGGALVAVEKLVVRLPPAGPGDPGAVRVEVFVSSVSSQAGFHSLRADPLKATDQPQKFSFPPTGARWIMLRFTAAKKAGAVALAEIAVLGYLGPPTSHYAFKEAPARAFDVLARLKKSSSLKVAISADEVALFADVQDGHFTKWSFDDAALLASGVVDAGKRQDYLKRIDKLEVGARAAIGGTKTPFEKGEKLLAWLHDKDGPLAKGYVGHQTDLSVILDTGTFNCVSSATLYNVLGRRLGLDVRAIEVPDHAFAILYDGIKHADVETTTSSGFNPSRDDAAQAEFAKKTGFRYIPESHRDERREIGEAGLVAIIYYNHGVALTQEKRHHEALLAYFRAMSLDREFVSAVKNALSSLANWSGELSADGKFDLAMNVLTTGLDLAPKDATLRHNRQVFWGQWAEAAAKTGNDDEAVDILRRAAKEIPDGNFAALQAWIYIRRGEELATAGNWEKAMAVVEPGFKKIDKAPQEELHQWQAGVPLRWANAEMDKRNFAKAVDVLNAARAQAPKDERLTGNLVYAVQEWIKDVHAKAGEAKATALVGEQLKRFPELTKLKEISASHAHRVVSALSDAGKYEEALGAFERHQDLLKGNNNAKALAYNVYDQWAGSSLEKKKWQEAVDVYAKALQRFPKDDHLTNNAVAAWEAWASMFIDAKNWAGAIQVYEKALKQFPKDGTLQNNLAYCKEQKKK